MANTFFPYTLVSLNLLKNSSGNGVRINWNNGATYSVTASGTFANIGAVTTQGFSAIPGDGGKATLDGGTSTAAVISDVGTAGNNFIDLIFSTSFASGSTDLVTTTRISTWIRCVFTGARGNGVVSATAATFLECEAYACNKSNTAGNGGFKISGGNLLRCYAHDNSGNANSGIVVANGPAQIQNCITETNGQYGINSVTTSANGAVFVDSCDFYNNGSDGINIPATAINFHWIENCNFIKNTGAGVNNVSLLNAGFIYNCGYGAGTQANGSADTTNSFVKSGTVTYASNVTPWNAPTSGDFKITLATSKNAGRGAFTQTDGTNTGTTAFPDIGSAQHIDSGGTATQKAYTFIG